VKEKKEIHLRIRVQPRSQKQRMEKTEAGEYRVWVISPPSKGEANKEVVEVISSYFDVPRTRIRIIGGHRSRHKSVVLELEGESDIRFHKR
jgi:uncharacterized protein (TIGR00251 family)